MAGSVYAHHRADTLQRWAGLAQTPPAPGCSLDSPCTGPRRASSLLVPGTCRSAWASKRRKSPTAPSPWNLVDFHAYRGYGFTHKRGSASLGTVQALLGHSSSQITREVYLHSVPTDAKDAVQRLENLFDGPKRTQPPDCLHIALT
jgi:integrase